MASTFSENYFDLYRYHQDDALLNLSIVNDNFPNNGFKKNRNIINISEYFESKIDTTSCGLKNFPLLF